MQNFVPRFHAEGIIRIKCWRVLIRPNQGLMDMDCSRSISFYSNSLLTWLYCALSRTIFLPNRCTRRLRGWMSMRWQQIIGGYLTVVQMFLCGFFLTRYSVLDLFLNIWGNLLRGISWFQWTSTVSTQVNPLKRFFKPCSAFHDQKFEKYTCAYYFRKGDET